jgi:hypothetical protein
VKINRIIGIGLIADATARKAIQAISDALDVRFFALSGRGRRFVSFDELRNLLDARGVVRGEDFDAWLKAQNLDS